jgi:hypothetical protein
MTSKENWNENLRKLISEIFGKRNHGCPLQCSDVKQFKKTTCVVKNKITKKWDNNV